MTDYPILVISLTDAVDRRQMITQRLAALNLEFNFIDAVDGRNGLPAEYSVQIDRQKAEKTSHYPMTDGEFACALSHRSAYQKIIDENLAGAIVLEDDAIIQDNFAPFVLEKLYKEAPMILLDYSKVRVTRSHHRTVSSLGHLARILSNPVFATGYSLSRAAASKMLLASTPVRSVADWPIDLYQVKAHAITPRLVKHEETNVLQSSLEADRMVVKTKRRPKPVGRYFTRMYWRRHRSVGLAP